MTTEPKKPALEITQPLAVLVQIGDGQMGRLVQIPVADTADALRVMKLINKTPGKLIFGEETDAPMTIHCGRVVFMQTVLMQPMMQAPQIARIN